MRKSTITRGSGSTKESSGLGVSDQPHRSQSDSEDESEYSGEEENRERMNDTTSVQSQHVTHTFQVQKTNQLLIRLIDHVKKTERRVEAIEDNWLRPSAAAVAVLPPRPAERLYHLWLGYVL